ncbi:MAG: nucleotidyltransferase family protein [Patescibacteria group bacterium]|nr:nucleotidyltransferase family protein [Patescibacteria group bacterium]
MKKAVGTLDQVKSKIDSHREQLRKDYHVKQIGVFGSVARNENVAGSDVDILVDFSEPIGFFKFVELEESLSKILGRKVDLVTKKAIKQRIKDNVLKETVYV